MDNLNKEDKKLTRHEMALKSTLDGVRVYVQIRDSERKYAEKTIKGAKGRIGVQEVAEIKKSKDPEDMKKKRYNAAAKFYYNKDKGAWDVKILGRKESLERQLKLLKELEESDMELGEEKANITEVRELIENELKVREEKAKAKNEKKEEEKKKAEAEKKKPEEEKKKAEAEKKKAEEANKKAEAEKKDPEPLKIVPKMPTRADVYPINPKDIMNDKKEDIAKDYMYYKDLMVQSYYGNHQYAMKYDQAVRRIAEHSAMRKCSITYKDPKTGEDRVVKYNTIKKYKGYENDAKFTQLEEYERRLTRKNQYEAGYPYAYPDTPEGDALYKQDKEYLETYNQKYNSRKVTYEHLKTLGNYGEKVPYTKIKENDNLGMKVLYGALNALKFVRNHTTAPINKFIGTKIVAPLYKRNAIENGKWDFPNPYENRATHRYEKRKEYFRSQGANFITSRLKAIINYKEGNECTLAAKGKDLMDDIVLRESDKAIRNARYLEADAYAGLLKTYCERLIREKADLGESEKELKGQYDQALMRAGRTYNNTVYEMRMNDPLINRRDLIDVDAIDKGTHELRNKKNVTRVITGVKMFARAGIKFVGEKLGAWMADHAVTTKHHDAITQRVDGHYAQEEYTAYEFSGQDKSLEYFLEGKEGQTVSLYRNTYDGGSSVPFRIDDDTVIRGIKTEINGSDISVSDLALKEYSEYCRYNIGPNFIEAMKQSTDLEHMGLSTQDIGQMIVNGEQGEVFLALSNTKSGIPTGWLRISERELKEFFGDSVKEVTKMRDGEWIEAYDEVVKEAWDEIVPNERLLKALNIADRVTDGISNAHLIDLIYENARDLDDRRNNFARAKANSKVIRKSKSSRSYDFIENEDELPEGKKDQRGFNYNPKTGEYEPSVVYDDQER